MKSRLYKLLLFCAMVILSRNTIAQTIYYVSATGDDLSAGTSELTAWQSLSKVNTSMNSFQVGDQILFKKGDSFFGKLVITKSGISIGAYGTTGAKPIISGGEAITTSWALVSGSTNIWETTITANKPSQLNRLAKDDAILPISRHPNKNVNNGYFNFESKSGLTQITDNELTNTPNWTGSEMVVRGEKYRLVKLTVTTHANSTLTFPSNSDVINLFDNFGYFFRNDVKAIDQDGEWAYAPSSGKISLFSNTSPSTSNLSFARVDTVLQIKNANDVIIDGIQVSMANMLGIAINNSNTSIIRNCVISRTGGGGVYYETVAGATLENSTIADVVWNGVNVLKNSSNMVIKFNTFTSMGDEAYLKAKTGYGIYCEAGESQILNNKFSMIGFGAIVLGGKNNLVSRNFINQCLLFGEDLGGIYTNFNLNDNDGTVIEENIILNALGEQKGAPSTFSLAQGFYVDNNSRNVTVRNNTAYNIGGSGLYANSYRGGNSFNNNTVYSAESELGLNTNATPEPFDIKNNILITNAKDSLHNVILIKTSSRTYPEMGLFTDNYVVNPFFLLGKPINDSYKQGTLNIGGRKTVYEWEAINPEVSGNIPSLVKYPTSINTNDFIKFVYNNSVNDSTITLPSGQFVNAKNQYFCGSFLLSPFRSEVLFKLNDNPCQTLSACDTPINPTSSFINDVTATVSWTAVAGVLNYDVRYRPVGNTTWKTYQNTTDLTVNLFGLQKSTTYEWQVRASCMGVEGTWTALNNFTTLALPICEAPNNLGTKELLGSSVILTWDAFKASSSYQVRYKQTSESSWITLNNIIEPNVFIAGIAPSQTYEFQVKCNCSLDNSDWSVSKTFTSFVGGQIYRSTINSLSQQISYDYSSKSFVLGTSTSAMLVGRASNVRSGVGIYSFPLPSIISGQQITGADFNVRVEIVGPNFVELWGLPYRSTGNPQLDDYYDGVNIGANQVNATRIQTPWFNGGLLTTAANVFPNTIGRTSLSNFFNTQYINGAIGGNWAFLRVNPTEPSTDFRLFFDKEDNDGHIPFVTLIMSPRTNSVPSAASNLVNNNRTPNTISLQWQDNANNETSVVIERKLSGGYYNPIDTLTANTTSYNNTGLSSSTQYSYRVLMMNADGVQGYSNEISVITLNNPPTNLTGIRQLDNSNKLSWNDAGVNVQGYEIERKSANGSFVVVGNTTAKEFTDANITTGFPYTYRVRSLSIDGNSDFSSEVIITENSYPIIALYSALSKPNASNTAGQAGYNHTNATNVVVVTPTTFNNTSSGCFISPAVNVTQAATNYASSLTTFAEFVVKPNTGFQLNLTSLNVKVRKASGANFTVLFRLAYSIDGGSYVDNGSNLTPTIAACSSAGFGTDASLITTQTWDFVDFEVPDGKQIRFRIYYFNQPTNTSIGLPLVTLNGSVSPVINSTLTASSTVVIPRGQTVNRVIGTLLPVPATLGGTSFNISNSSNGVTLTNLVLNPSSGDINADITTTCASTNANFTLSYAGKQNLSTPLSIVVNPLPTAVISGGGTVCAGATLPNISIALTGTSPWNITYSDGTMAIPVTGITTSPYLITGASAGTYTVTAVSDANCTGTSMTGTADVVVNTLPTAVISGGGTICTGATLPNISIALTATSPWNITYSDGTTPTTVTGITTSPYVITGASAGTYTVTAVSDANCMGTSMIGTADVVVNTLPTAVISGGGTICTGATLPNISIALTGTSPWNITYSDGTMAIPVTGITTSPYLITGASAGTYTVTAISDANCTGTSMTGTADVVVNALPTAVISGGGTICTGATLPNISIALTGTSPWNITYSDGTTPTTVTGITTSPYVITEASAGTYTVTAVSDANCTGTSMTGTANVVVNPLPTAVISGGGTVCAGATLPNISIPLTGTSPWNLTYSDGTTTIPVTGITTSPYVITGASAGTYTVTAVSDANCTGTSMIGTANVVVNPLPTAVISGGGTVCAGATLPNISIALTGTGPWNITYSDGTTPTTVTGITTSPYVITEASAGTYTVTAVSDANCTGTSMTGTANVVVNPLPTAVISGGGTVCAGATLPNVSIALTGTSPWNITYSDGTMEIPVTGITTSPYLITGASAGTYTVTAVSDANCTGTSMTGTADVVVNTLPTAVISGGGTICTGATLPNISIPLTGTSPWNLTYSDGTTTIPVTGITTSPYVITGASAGTYTVTAVSDANCTGTSMIGTADVVVNTLPTAVISGGGTICTGATLPNISIALTGTSPWHITYSDGTTPTTVTGITTSPYLITGASAGTYTVTAVSDANCTGTSMIGTANVVVNPLPKAVINNIPPICAGGTLYLTGNLGATYIWSGPNNFSSSSQNPSIDNITMSANGVYTLVVSNTYNCTATATSSLTIFPLPISPIITADNMEICKGNNSVLTASCASITDNFFWVTPSSNSPNNLSTLPSTSTRIITEPGTYKGYCQSNTGCLSPEVSIVISQASNCNGQVFISISPEKPIICPGASITLTATGCSGVVSWLGGVSTLTGASATFAPTVTTTYLAQCSTGGSASIDVVIAQNNVLVSSNISTGKSVIKAVSIIESDKKVGNPNFTPAPNVSYEAGNAIILKPGFVAEKSSTFSAIIKTCPN